MHLLQFSLQLKKRRLVLQVIFRRINHESPILEKNFMAVLGFRTSNSFSDFFLAPVRTSAKNFRTSSPQCEHRCAPCGNFRVGAHRCKNFCVGAHQCENFRTNAHRCENVCIYSHQCALVQNFSHQGALVQKIFALVRTGAKIFALVRTSAKIFAPVRTYAKNAANEA